MSSEFGWGGGTWGGSPWGGAFAPLSAELEASLAVSENVIRVQFSTPVYFSGLLDVRDASDRSKYTITPVAGTVGLDGTAVRPISPARIRLDTSPGVQRGRALLITTDRPMTPNPAQYVVSAVGLWTADLSSPISTESSAGKFNAVYREVAIPQVQTLAHRGDIANPQDYGAIAGGVTSNPTAMQLGCFVVDATGDYAVEAGLVGYKKRILRRIFSVPGAFLHLGNRYGVGVRQYGKKLGSAHNRAQLEAAIEQQVALEPETAKVSVKTSLDSRAPGLVYLVVLAQTKTGKTLKVITPINTSN